MMVVCETVAAITLHLREPTKDQPVNYGGSDGKTLTLCGMKVGWDTKIPVSQARCSKCILALTGP